MRVLADVPEVVTSEHVDEGTGVVEAARGGVDLGQAPPYAQYLWDLLEEVGHDRFLFGQPALFEAQGLQLGGGGVGEPGVG